MAEGVTSPILTMVSLSNTCSSLVSLVFLASAAVTVATSKSAIEQFSETNKKASDLNTALNPLLAKYEGTRVRLLPVMANQVMNRALKRIARLAGITSAVEVVETLGGRVLKKSVPKWELVTMHTARHTFAVQSLLRGMPVTVLQRVMGHAKIQNTMRYAQVVEELQHQAMRAAWDGPATAPALSALDSAVCTVMAA